MPLQVRVRHALGERLMELPDRTVENPVIVGRASACEVQVPSVSVASKHCALFRHEGHWVVQDIGGTTGTYVNGQPVGEPVFLQVGDVVSIGSEAAAPTLEVDPAAAAEGRTGWAGDEVAAAPAAGAAYGYAGAGYAAPPAGGYGGEGYAPQGGYPQPGYPQQGGYAQPAGYGQQGGGWGGNAAADPDAVSLDEAGWQGAAGASAGYESRPAKRRPAKQGTPQTAIIAGVLIGAVVVGITIWAVVRNSGDPVVVKEQTKKPGYVDDGESGKGGRSIFDPQPVKVKGGGVQGGIDNPKPPMQLKGTGGSNTGSTAKPAPAKTEGDTGEEPSSSAGGTQAPEATASTDTTPKKPDAGGTETAKADPPGKADAPKTDTPDATAAADKPEMTDKPDATASAGGGGDAWGEIENLNHSALAPAMAIFRMDDYRRNNPGKHEAEIDKWMEKKFDQIWWERIEQLFKKRDRLSADIQKKQKAIWDENNPEFKKKQIAEKTQMEKDLKRTNETLRDGMAFGGDQPPNPADKSMIAQLTEARDKNKYAAFKKETLHDIRDLKGRLKWEGDQ